jgi:formylglycine-generating enzyme required for sulfatase activity
MDTVIQVIGEDPVPPRRLNASIPLDLETICLKCLEKEPGRRYASAAALGEEIQRYLDGKPILARPVGQAERAWRWCRRNPLVAGLAAGVALALLLVVLGGWWTHGSLRAQGLVDTLLTAQTTDVPAVVRDLGAYRRWADPLLRKALVNAEADGDARKQLHARLALLPSDPGQVDSLRERLLGSEPNEMGAIRELLAPHGDSLVEPLWAVLEDRAAQPSRRLRAACALATYAPDDGRWETVSGDVAGWLVAENPLMSSKWAESLRPVGRLLLAPLAALLLEEGRGTESRRLITGLYAGYIQGAPDAFAPLERALAERSDPQAAAPTRAILAGRQANAAVALAAMRRWEKVWPLLRHTPEPTLRSYLFDRLGPGGVGASALIDRLNPDREQDVSARRALLLAMGEFDAYQLSLAEREALAPQLLASYRDDPDPGIHGAAGWLLRKWAKQVQVTAIDRGLATGQVEGQRQWYVNRQGQTLVLVPPGEFESESRDGQRFPMRVELRFALAAREVTLAEFRRFRKDHNYQKEFTPAEDCPVAMETWYEAAAYCNWLSKHEGIAEEQWCYVPNEKGDYAEGMKVKAGALDRSGYRLPTESEWERACRAGSVTSWSMGEAADLVSKYAWYNLNSRGMMWPVGSLRPNDLGFFDLHGNAYEWCFGHVEELRNKRDPISTKVDSKRYHPWRGGSFSTSAQMTRSSEVLHNFPGFKVFGGGFRVARTFH